MLLRSLSGYCVNITNAITKNRTNESPTPEKGLEHRSSNRDRLVLAVGVTDDV